jgi:hypothetical protein
MGNILILSCRFYVPSLSAPAPHDKWAVSPAIARANQRPQSGEAKPLCFL